MANISTGVTPVSGLGVGYNTFLSSARSQMVKIQSTDFGHSAESNVYVCTSTEDVYNALGIKTEIAVGSPWGSFESKMEFASGLQSHSLTVTILVVASKIISTLAATSVNFIDPNPASAIDLFNVGGDSYVSTIQMGGEYLASYNFDAYDQTAYQQLTAAISTSFKGVSTFNANFQTSITNIEQTQNVKTTFNQKAIGWSNIPFPSTDEFTKFVLNFNDVPLDGPEVIDFDTESYKTVQGCPDFKQIDDYRADYVNPSSTAYAYSDKLLQARSNLPLINDIAKIYNYYDMVSIDQNLITFPQNLQYMMSEIGNWLANVDDDPTDPTIPPPDIQDEFFQLPTAQYGITTGSRAGGTGGNNFLDASFDDIALGILPTRLSFYGDAWVDRITTQYTYQDANYQPKELTHGGNTGNTPEVIDLGTAGNVMTYLGATWGGDYIDRLTTATSLNPTKVTYPPGSTGGDQFTQWDFPENSAFIGWGGSSADYIDALQPIFATFSPCKWSSSLTGKNIFNSTEVV